MKNVSIGVVLFLLVGCSPVFYAPNSQNVPMFTEQGQGEFGFGVGSAVSPSNGGVFSSTFELQTAYSFFDNWAGQVNYMRLSSMTSLTNFVPNRHFNYIEGAFGYFLPFHENLVLEVYPGIGFGSVSNSILLTDISLLYADASFTKLFLQPSIGYHIKGFEVSFSARLTYLNYYKIDHNIPFENFKEVGLDQLEKEYINFEPALSFGWRFKNLKLEMQWYGTTPIGTKFLPSYDRGVIMTLSFLLKKKKDEFTF